MASLFNLSVPKGRAKASNCSNNLAPGWPHVVQSFRLISGGGAKIFHSIFFSGFIHDHCHLEYPLKLNDVLSERAEYKVP